MLKNPLEVSVEISRPNLNKISKNFNEIDDAARFERMYIAKSQYRTCFDFTRKLSCWPDFEKKLHGSFFHLNVQQTKRCFAHP